MDNETYEEAMAVLVELRAKILEVVEAIEATKTAND
jgi:hypothetical protein